MLAAEQAADGGAQPGFAFRNDIDFLHVGDVDGGLDRHSPA